MNSTKQHLAETVKQQAAALQAAITKAEAAGLTVKLTPATGYIRLQDADVLQVEVWEKISY